MMFLEQAKARKKVNLMEQTELWYKKLGFYNNPFSIKPAAFHSEVVGYELNGLFSKIESGSINYVKGNMGVGKTTILKNIISRFGGKGKVIYTSCNTSDRKTNFKKLLTGTSFMNRLLSSPSKNMILLVDEAQDIKKQESSEVLRFFKKGNFKSVVFFGTEYPEDKFNPELSKLAKDNIQNLTKLKPDYAVELVRKRVGTLEFISDATIKKIYRLSGFNPRKLLENCEDVFKHAVDSGAEQITEKHIKSVVKEVKMPKKKPAAEKAPRIVIEEINEVNLPLNIEADRHTKKKQETGYRSIRTYEEEMDTIRKELNEDI